MHEDFATFGAEPSWVMASAGCDAPDAPDPRYERRPSGARGALAIAILGVICLGFILGPWAVSLARRAELARLDVSGAVGDDSHARAAESLGKLGWALHLALALTVVPWLLLPLMR